MSDILDQAKEALDCGDIQGRTSIVLGLVAECERLHKSNASALHSIEL